MLRLTRQDLSNMPPDPTQWYDVTIIETLEQVVRVEAHSPEEAEQNIARDWRRREIVLDGGNFVGVEFAAIPVEDEQDKSPVEGT